MLTVDNFEYTEIIKNFVNYLRNFRNMQLSNGKQKYFSQQHILVQVKLLIFIIKLRVFYNNLQLCFSKIY